MKLVPLVLALAPPSCASLEAPPARAEVRPAAPRYLPDPSGPLVFEHGSAAVPLAWLLAELARLTGLEFVYGDDVRAELERHAETLESRAPVPTDEVYAFVETILLANDLYLALGPTGARPILHVLDARGHRRGGVAAEASAVPLTEAELDELERHPALLFQVALRFENIDTRQLQTQLRQLLVDPSGLQNVVPAGERTLIVQGLGAKVRGLITLLKDVDAASAADRPQTQAEQAAPPR